MDILKTPHEMLLELANLPHYAMGGHAAIDHATQNLTPQQMQAALIINGNTPPRFQYGAGGSVANTILNLLFHPNLASAMDSTTDNPSNLVNTAYNIGSLAIPAAESAGLYFAKPTTLANGEDPNFYQKLQQTGN